MFSTSVGGGGGGGSGANLRRAGPGGASGDGTRRGGGGGTGQVEPGDGGAGVEVAAVEEARRDEPAPHARCGVRREVHGDGAAAPVQQRQQPGGSLEAQRLGAADCAAGGQSIGGGVGGAGESNMLYVAAGEGARVVVAAIETGDSGDAELAEEVCVVLRAEDAAAAVNIGPYGASGEAGVGGRRAEEKDAVGDDGEDLSIDGAAGGNRTT
jgi:hypothetical protein